MLLLLALPVCAKELAIGGQWQLDSKQAGSGSSDSTQFWVGYERETQSRPHLRRRPERRGGAAALRQEFYRPRRQSDGGD
ncbi:hypothetical protein KBAD10_33080 [Aeromonas dhakensis]|nr:hypothetical protein KBAD10_33080 [Aeromonas dhakensis]